MKRLWTDRGARLGQRGARLAYVLRITYLQIKCNFLEHPPRKKCCSSGLDEGKSPKRSGVFFYLYLAKGFVRYTIFLRAQNTRCLRALSLSVTLTAGAEGKKTLNSHVDKFLMIKYWFQKKVINIFFSKKIFRCFKSKWKFLNIKILNVLNVAEFFIFI